MTWLTYFYLALQPLSVIRCLELAESNIYRSWINRVWSFLNPDDMGGTVYGPPHTSRHWPQLTCSEHAWVTRRQCWPLCLLTNGPPSLLRFRTERIFFLSCFNLYSQSVHVLFWWCISKKVGKVIQSQYHTVCMPQRLVQTWAKYAPWTILISPVTSSKENKELTPSKKK